MPKSKNRRKRRRRHKRVQRRGFRVQIGANLLPIVNARKHDDLKIQTDMLSSLIKADTLFFETFSLTYDL